MRPSTATRPKSVFGSSYLPSWDDDCVSGKKRDPRVFSLQRLLVVERDLLLFPCRRSQNVDTLGVRKRRDAAAGDNRLQWSHARAHHDGTDLAHFADQEDSLAVDSKNHYRDHGILNVLFESLTDI